MELFRKLLLSFRKKNAGAVPEIRAALAAGDGETATRLAHTLKGVAGNLAVTDVQDRAKDVEAALRAEEDPGTGLDDLADAVAAAVQALEVLEPSAPEATAATADPERLRVLLDRLGEMLSDSDTDSLGVIAALRDAARGSEHQAQIEELSELVEEFDFDAAITRLDSMKGGTA